MVKMASNVSQKFRNTFKCSNKSVLRWFPGHMNKGWNQIQQKLKSVDCIIEAHDARIPFSGRNPRFNEFLTSLKPHLLVLNKKDLADLDSYGQVKQKLQSQGVTDVILTNCKDLTCPGLAKVIPAVRNLVNNSNRYNRSEEPHINVMVVGVPNVGKSSLINCLRHKYMKLSRAAPVGGIAGITRSVGCKIKVMEHPPIYVFDTPGILTPYVPDVTTAFNLALCSTMQDHLVGHELIADYLLYWLNKNGNFRYVKYLGLNEPTDNITEALAVSALTSKKTIKLRAVTGGYDVKPDLNYAARYFIDGFRTGEFGKVLLDNTLVDNT